MEVLLYFLKKWFSGDPGQVAVGQIAGVKMNVNGDFGGGLAFFTGGDGQNALSERMRISNAGNVGIGTANPSSKLDVSGDIKMSGRILGTRDYNVSVSNTSSTTIVSLSSISDVSRYMITATFDSGPTDGLWLLNKFNYGNLDNVQQILPSGRGIVFSITGGNLAVTHGVGGAMYGMWISLIPFGLF